ncbi:aspartate-semialdehyde dehydrogenase [Candidatus Caldatribacterium sp.]|uniref:aspartate-semialdehyde dehydrogenase n=1 Tax=Candidatus Caldatribacterium sp. TaxID=2282143 RepID=UPI0029957DF2|nr:aspartate-semialdehyde dehydrogenase [Candidatus Caldatribacterium sp.]MDW8081391.1 aspartate-semialdehyde dehydrogenase [Candidatus Calescibacterium sp.]
MKALKVAVVGATGAVGQEMLRILEERNFPVRDLKPLASSRSLGKKVRFRGEDIPVEVLGPSSFEGCDLALFSAGASVSREFAPCAVASGCLVVDNSSAFRLEEDIPLVVPEVNPHRIHDVKKRGIIANPNCTTIIAVVPLKPLHDYGKIRRIVAASYQATSGAGAQAMRELEEQVIAYVQGRTLDARVFPYQIAFNLIPHIDVFLENFYTKEEMKMVWETRKIMEDPTIQVTATCVRVPVFRAHSVAINVETERKISREKAIELLASFPGVIVQDDPKNRVYPMPLFVAGKDECYVGRIREDISLECGLNLWVVGDQLRKGAALNAIQIAELLLREGIL